MKSLTFEEMRAVDGGGASKHNTCPICGYKRKSSWLERLFGSNANILMNMEARHYSIGKGYNGSQSVHK